MSSRDRHPSSGEGNSFPHVSADRPAGARLQARAVRAEDELPKDWIGPPRPGGIWGDLSRWPGVLFGYRDLIRTCVWRDLRLRFSGSVLGVLWPLVHPLFLFGIYYFVFAELLGLRMPGTVPGGGQALGLWMFTGTLVWTNFADSVHRSTSCLVDHRNLIGKLAFPSQVLPLNIVLANLATLTVAAVALVGVTSLTGLWAGPGWQLLWLPLILLAQALLTTGLGLLLAAIHVFLRDTQQIVGICLGVAMFLTPVFWVPSAEAVPGIERWLPLVEASPLHHLLQAWRVVLMGGEPAICFTGTISTSLVIVALWGAGLFIVGHAVFRSLQHRFADEV
jgi:ABC-type polysaccharide/polyol phosphate export permease